MSPERAMLLADQEAAQLVNEEEPGEGWEIPFFGAKASAAYLVKRLDRDGVYFYVVPFVRNGRETGRMVLDAESGELLEVDALEGGEDNLEPWIPAPARIDGSTPPLVWKPCAESQTPLLPFYEIEQDGRVSYLRADGVPFERLTRRKGR